MPEGKLTSVLRDLARREIRFILVGGLAAVLHGAPVHTYDVDVVYCRQPENIRRLLDFLTDADAIFRTQPERKLRPDESHMGRGHLNLLTRYGPLDLLGTIGNGLDYDALLPRSTPMSIGAGVSISVLNLEAIIAIKEQLGTEKDLAVLPTLRRTLKESRESGV